MKTAYQKPDTQVISLHIRPIMLGGSNRLDDIGANPVLPGIGARGSRYSWDDEEDEE